MESALVLTPGELALRLVVAALAGGALGVERELEEKPAGLRTHMMVALGSACFCLVGFGLSLDVEERTAARVVLDPSRIVAGVVGGIGFLGAGAIIRTGSSVEGLTTATSIWLAGALGVAVAAGAYWLAGLAVVLGLAILRVLGSLERRMKPH